MFSSDYGGILHTRQSFYGNDAVCLFKYFVTKDDPQGIFVFAILCLNFVCFATIGLAYAAIVSKTKKSAKRVATRIDVEATKNANTRLQRITTMITFTDFVCWVPFIVICSFHFLDILDATAWYSFFSISVLPINSVINPLLYNASARTFISSQYTNTKERLNEGLVEVRLKLTATFRVKRNKVNDNSDDVRKDEEIELKEIKSTEIRLILCRR